jgi:hypothetical protein
VKDKNRLKRHEKCKLPERKKLRAKRQMEQLRADTNKVIQSRAKGDATYLSGLNMAEGTVDGYTEQDLADAAKKKTPAKKKRKVDPNIVCKHCGLKGHSRTRSKQCLKNPANANRDNAPVVAAIATSSQSIIQEEIDAAGDMDEMSDASNHNFEDAGNSSSDDGEDITPYMI